MQFHNHQNISYQKNWRVICQIQTKENMTEPNWTIIKPTRQITENWPPTLKDIESHMPANHPYRDKRHVTHAHETTHGLNSRIRSQEITIVNGLPIPQSTANNNASYVLNDKAFIAAEPPTTLSIIASKVPDSLKGMAYRLYLIDQQRYWQNQPLYVFDEWSAYTNGLNTALDENGGDGTYSDTLQMIEFIIYSLTLATIINKTNYNDTDNINKYVKWQITRCMQLYNKATKISQLMSESITNYLNKLKTANDGEPLRQHVKTTYGENTWNEWFEPDKAENYHLF